MSDELDWNVLVTAQEGRAREVQRELARLAPLRRCRFRHVFLGRVDDFEAFAAAVDVEGRRKPFLE